MSPIKTSPIKTSKHLQSLSALILATCAAMPTSAQTYEPLSAEPALEAIMRIEESRLSKTASQLDLKAGLFHYWQNNHLEGLKVATQNADKQGADGTATQAPPSDNIMLGQMMVAWGLYDEAERFFATALRNAKPEDANVVWLNLAQRQFETGLKQQALQTIDKHIQQPEKWVQSEVQVLRALYYIEQGNKSAAKHAINSIPSLGSLSPYSLYNVAIIHTDLGHTDTAANLFDVLMSIPENSPELAMLRDRATLALGLTFLRQNNSEYAALALEDIRANSTYANVGLLAKGWAHFHNEEWDQAYSAWAYLTQQDTSDLLTLEAKINLADLYVRRDKIEQSHTLSDSAIAELLSLRQFIVQERQRATSSQGMSHIHQRLSEKHALNSLNYSAELRTVQSKYQEIFELERTLIEWSAMLGTLNRWAAQRTQSLQNKQVEIAAIQSRLNQQAGNALELNQVNTQLHELNASKNSWKSATDEQSQLRDQLAGLRKNVQNLDEADPMRALLLKRVNRLEGLLLWDILDEESAIAATVESNNNLVNAQFVEATSRLSFLQTRHAAQLATLQQWQTDFAPIQAHLNALMQRTAALKQAQAMELQKVYEGELDKLDANLVHLHQRALLTRAALTEAQLAR